MTKRSAMRAYVAKMHRGQKRQDGTPARVHVERVATLLLTALKESGEGSAGERIALECAALGHDLLEDTRATQQQIARIASKNSLRWIEENTNRLGDDHPKEFVHQMRRASEEARLIKLADLSDNLLQASISIRGLGLSWMHSYFLPIVDPMRVMLAKSSFRQYPKTAAILRATVALARAHLATSIAHYTANNSWRR